MPGLLYDYLKQATEGKLVSRISEADLAQLRKVDEGVARKNVRAISGAGLFFGGAVLTGLEVGPWYLFDVSVTGMLSLVVGVWLLVKANRG